MIIFKENDCRKGYQCSDPGNPQACLAGTFNENLNAMNCEQCSIGTNCSKTGQKHQRECAVGFECSDPAHPNKCLSGSLATSPNQTECLPCPTGMNCANPIKPEICPDGLYAAESKTSCIICSPGNYCSNGIVHQCIRGKDCSEEGQYQVDLTRNS